MAKWRKAVAQSEVSWGQDKRIWLNRNGMLQVGNRDKGEHVMKWDWVRLVWYIHDVWPVSEWASHHIHCQKIPVWLGKMYKQLDILHSEKQFSQSWVSHTNGGTRREGITSSCEKKEWGRLRTEGVLNREADIQFSCFVQFHLLPNLRNGRLEIGQCNQSHEEI